eukprot:7762655-Alexandrium_andersonii.AAC.1
MSASLVGSEMCIRDRETAAGTGVAAASSTQAQAHPASCPFGVAPAVGIAAGTARAADACTSGK